MKICKINENVTNLDLRKIGFYTSKDRLKTIYSANQVVLWDDHRWTSNQIAKILYYPDTLELPVMPTLDWEITTPDPHPNYTSHFKQLTKFKMHPTWARSYALGYFAGQGVNSWRDSVHPKLVKIELPNWEVADHNPTGFYYMYKHNLHYMNLIAPVLLNQVEKIISQFGEKLLSNNSMRTVDYMWEHDKSYSENINNFFTTYHQQIPEHTDVDSVEVPKRG